MSFITVRLPVPLCEPLQEDGFSCVPRCVKMIFMYIETSHPEGRVPDFDLEKIGKIIETRVDGTYPDMILNLNGVKEVSSSIPSIEFEFELKSHSLTEIEKEIEKKQPPIAWVELTDNQHRCTHAVVITGIDKPNDKILFNDPIFGEQSEYLSNFISRWENEDRVLVKVKIGKKKQRMLEEFGKEKELQK